MPDPVTLPVQCAHCGGKVTLQMSDWPRVADAENEPPTSDKPLPPQTSQTWTCPYCNQANEGGFPDGLAWVRKGHEPESTA